MSTDAPLGRETIIALGAFRIGAQRLGINALVPPQSFASRGAFTSWRAQALTALSAELKQVTHQIERLKHAKPSPDRSRGWEEVERVCGRSEELLRSIPTLRERLEEGRRSLMPRVTKALNDYIEVEIEEEGKHFIARLNPKNLQELEESLPEWAESWLQHTLDWVNYDLQQSLRLIWSPRQHTLPIGSPPFEPIATPTKARIQSTFHLSDLEIKRKKSGLVGGIYRHARTALYGAMSIAFLSGLRGNIDPMIGKILMILTGISAVTYGLSQARADKEQERDKLREELEKRSERLIQEAVKIWLDRVADKLNGYLREEGYQRRFAFVHWYQSVLLPAKESARASKGEAGARAQDLMTQQVSLEQRLRALQRAREELTKIA